MALFVDLTVKPAETKELCILESMSAPLTRMPTDDEFFEKMDEALSSMEEAERTVFGEELVPMIQTTMETEIFTALEEEKGTALTETETGIIF